MPAAPRSVALIAGSLSALWGAFAGDAWADEPPPPNAPALAAAAPASPTAPAVPTAEASAPLAASAEPSTVTHTMGSMAFGTGLRFNNPYRLSRELGSDAESLSLTSGYFDLGGAYAWGSPSGLAHGASLRLSLALSGVGQATLTPTYLAAKRGPMTLLFARLGPSFVLSPDVNVGGEAALGAVYFLTGAVGASAEMVFDVYYGAGTEEAKFTVYPVLSGQFGVFIDYEVLP